MNEKIQKKYFKKILLACMSLYIAFQPFFTSGQVLAEGSGSMQERQVEIYEFGTMSWVVDNSWTSTNTDQGRHIICEYNNYGAYNGRVATSIPISVDSIVLVTGAVLYSSSSSQFVIEFNGNKYARVDIYTKRGSSYAPSSCFAVGSYSEHGNSVEENTYDIYSYLVDSDNQYIQILNTIESEVDDLETKLNSIASTLTSISINISNIKTYTNTMNNNLNYLYQQMSMLNMNFSSTPCIITDMQSNSKYYRTFRFEHTTNMTGSMFIVRLPIRNDITGSGARTFAIYNMTKGIGKILGCINGYVIILIHLGDIYSVNPSPSTSYVSPFAITLESNMIMNNPDVSNGNAQIYSIPYTHYRYYELLQVLQMEEQTKEIVEALKGLNLTPQASQEINNIVNNYNTNLTNINNIETNFINEFNTNNERINTDQLTPTNDLSNSAAALNGVFNDIINEVSFVKTWIILIMICGVALVLLGR